MSKLWLIRDGSSERMSNFNPEILYGTEVLHLKKQRERSDAPDFNLVLTAPYTRTRDTGAWYAGRAERVLLSLESMRVDTSADEISNIMHANRDLGNAPMRDYLTAPGIEEALSTYGELAGAEILLKIIQYKYPEHVLVVAQSIFAQAIGRALCPAKEELFLSTGLARCQGFVFDVEPGVEIEFARKID